MIDKRERCIYCGKEFDASKGAGDHIIPAALGEFENDVRFRRICQTCNNRISPAEQQLVQCGPEALFRRIVDVPTRRRRNRCASQLKQVMGAPTPTHVADLREYRLLVRMVDVNARKVTPVDQIILTDPRGKEHFIQLFPGIREDQVRKPLDELGFDDKWTLRADFIVRNEEEYLATLRNVIPKGKFDSGPLREPGTFDVDGQTQFALNVHYFRAIAKIAFHYYLAHSRRGVRGDEPGFASLREFIMNGGSWDQFVMKEGPQFAMPFGKVGYQSSVTPGHWCHVLAAYEGEKMSFARLQLFVGPGCVPLFHNVKLGVHGGKVLLTEEDCVWAHVYRYDAKPRGQRWAGRVERCSITRLR